MNIKVLIIGTAAFLLAGCAAKQTTMPFDDELYDGQSVESFEQK